MPMPVSVTFQGLSPSQALQADIERRAHRLERFASDLLGCEVTVRRSEDRHHQGNRYLVHVRVQLSGGTLEAGRTTDHSHEDPYVAVRDAFDAMRRQVEDFVRIRRGDVKAHSRPKGSD